MKQYKRSDRLAEQILRDVSTLLSNELREVIPGLVTFTYVKLSDDLRYAKVHLSYLGNDDGRQKVLDYLEREAGRIRSVVGQNLRMRHIPEFLFRYDASVERGIRVEQLLNEIKNERENK
ncbi:MAG TPA: 30S ribosome-binding factor RbfA [Candidatus Acidoferrum sp.]|nr:30S ribosome-binding factor RbfA [Candidatus Acidoferrum sp.]